MQGPGRLKQQQLAPRLLHAPSCCCISRVCAAGKSAERPVLSEEVIERNVAGIERTLRTLLRPPPGRCGGLLGWRVCHGGVQVVSCRSLRWPY